MGKAPLSSKTIRFHLAMVAIQSIGGSFAIFQPLVEPMTYAMIVAALGVLQSVGGVYLRLITEEPIK